MPECSVCGSIIKIDYMSELIHYEKEDYIPSEYGVHFFCGKHAKMYLDNAEQWIEETRKNVS